jgi:cytochrome b561
MATTLYHAKMGTPSGFAGISRSLHWITVALFIVVFGVTYFWHGADKATLTTIHKSCGVTILVLTLLRLVHWGVVPRPKLLATSSGQQAVARVSHVLLYVIMLVQPALGWVGSMMGNHPVRFFFVWNLPTFLPSDHAAAGVVMHIHRLMANVILAVIAVHIAAALYHHFIVKDRTLARMISG